MNQILLKYEILPKNEFEKIPEGKILDFLKIGDHVLVGLNSNENEDPSNISIGVASAITAYSRIFMTQFKNNSNIKLYYTDTDSIYISSDSELNDNLIDSKILGKLKLEYEAEEAIFLGPKLYCLKTKKGLITKVKGLKDVSTLKFEDFKDLLNIGITKIRHHDKWFRDLQSGKITIKEQIYTVSNTDNKRNNIISLRKILE